MSEPLSVRLGYAVLADVLRPLVNAFLGKTWRGVDKLPHDQGVIVAANHMSEVDPVVVGQLLYSNKIKPHFLAKEQLFRIPVFGKLLTMSQQIPVQRGGIGASKSLEVAREVLASNGAVVVYPEGTLTRDPAMWPMKGRTGVARLALGTGAPVIPVAHWGAQDLLPAGSKKPRLFPRKHVSVIVGEPVDLSEFEGLPLTRTSLEAATDKIMDAITALQEELRGERAPERRWDPRAQAYPEDPLSPPERRCPH